MENLKKKILYWHMRYLIITELFMVEQWERNIFHGLALIFLAILGLFNQLLVVGGVRLIRQLYYQYTTSANLDQIPTEL